MGDTSLLPPLIMQYYFRIITLGANGNSDASV